MKKHSYLNWLMIVIAILPLVYLAVIWDSLPPIVATHFGPDMKPDKMSDKGELWIPAGVLAVVSILVYFLFQNIHRFDPKRRDAPHSSTFNKLAAGMVVFLSALNFIIIQYAKGTMYIQNFLFPLLGLMFAFLGNYMNHIKPNYFAGFRLPWTLSSDENWRKTHQLGGKLWFAGGMTLAIAGLFLHNKFIVPVFIGIVVIITIIPIVYSYRLFKQESA